MKMVVLDGHTLNPGDNPWDGLSRLGELTVHARTGQGEVQERAREADILFTNKTRLDRELLGALPRLAFVSVLATGYDVVDVEAAGALGIPVSNVPEYGTDSVAQFVFALLLELCHGTALHHSAVRHGEWTARGDFSFWKTPQVELAGKTMGIVGYGRIGARVGELAHAFGMDVAAYNPRPKNAPDHVTFTSLGDLFATADVVSLHCPMTGDNKEFVNQHLLRRMKPWALLINTARGDLVNQNDLVEALTQETLAGAALDVVSPEPIPEHSPLLALPNCLITPHMAWATQEARQRLMRQTVKNVEAFLDGSPVNVVNWKWLPDRGEPL